MKTLLLSVVAPVDQEVRTSVEQWIPRDPGILILVGALLVTTLGVFIWAAFFRKSSRPHYHFRRHRPDQPIPVLTERRKSRRFFFGKRHRHRHRERRRNPTLAEAGGLPPIRSDEPPPSST